MLTLPRLHEGLSAIGAIRRWCQDQIVPQASAPPATEQQSVARLSSRCDLLLIRMEALQLQPSEMKHLETAIFQDMAAACSRCEHKDQCERDLAYLSAGTDTPDWEKYCPNAAVLNAMRELPWFGNQSRTRTD